MDIKEQDILGDQIEQHWYYNSKAAALSRVIDKFEPENILDIGAGSGFFSKYLLTHTNAKTACCVDPAYESDDIQNVANKEISFCRSIENCPHDLFLFMDVLEHVDDDTELLSYYVKRAPIGAKFVVTVPAFNFLWSNHDVFLEHRRRYTVNQVIDCGLRSNLAPKLGCYYFASIFPLVAGVRLFERMFLSKSEKPESNLRVHSPVVNSILSFICRLELPFFKINKLFGLSVFVVFVKENEE